MRLPPPPPSGRSAPGSVGPSTRNVHAPFSRTAATTIYRSSAHVRKIVRVFPLGVPLAVRLRSNQSVEQNVQVANHGKNERVVEPDMVCDGTLYHGKDCTAHDGHGQYAGSAPRQWTQFCHSQTEDGGEHDRVEEPDRKNGPHRRMPACDHGDDGQCRGEERAERKEVSGLDTPQEWCAKKASNHRATPVERNKTCCSLGGKARNLR